MLVVFLAVGVGTAINLGRLRGADDRHAS